MIPERQPWHTLRRDVVVAALASSADAGLTHDQAADRLRQHGPNALPEGERRALVAVLIGQFKSPLIYLLFAAAAVAVALGHVGDAVVIFVVVLLNAGIGAFQEGRAERSLQAIRNLATHRARVLRDGRESLVEASELVSGDVVILEAGDAVAADARLLHAAALHVAESALTGESLPVFKDPAPLDADTPLADRKNMVFAGTHVTAGRARALVVGTGQNTEIGKIASLAETAEQPKTPLERRIDRFGRYIIVTAAVVFAAVVTIGLLRGVAPAEIVMIGISQVVGMIPEGLPVAMTIALAVGVQRMAKRRAVVRRLAAVETLGSTTVICSDKTGTLTRNEMTATTLWLPDGRLIVVTGTGYEPVGAFVENGAMLDVGRDHALREILETALLCNDALLQGPEESTPRWKPMGDPTEVALVVLAMKAGLVPTEVREHSPRRAEIPFDSAAKVMATEHVHASGTRVLLKGAPEVLLQMAARCDEAARLRRSMSTRHARSVMPAIAWQRRPCGCSPSALSTAPRSRSTVAWPHCRDASLCWALSARSTRRARRCAWRWSHAARLGSEP